MRRSQKPMEWWTTVEVVDWLLGSNRGRGLMVTSKGFLRPAWPDYSDCSVFSLCRTTAGGGEPSWCLEAPRSTSLCMLSFTSSTRYNSPDPCVRRLGGLTWFGSALGIRGNLKLLWKTVHRSEVVYGGWQDVDHLVSKSPV